MIGKNPLLAALVFLLVATLAPFTLQANSPLPVFDHSTVLDTLDVTGDGDLIISNNQGYVLAAFLPESPELTLKILNDSGAVLYENQKTFVERTGVSAFNRLSMPHFRFNIANAGPGDYTFVAEVSNKIIYELPFSYRFVEEGDDFSRKTVHLLDGADWRTFATLEFPQAANNRQSVVASAWVENGRINATTKISDLPKSYFELYLNGDRVAGPHVNTYKAKGGSSHYAVFGSWSSIQTDLTLPESKGGGQLQSSDILSTDGVYDLFMITDGSMSAGWQFEIKDGKQIMHPRQASSHEPRKEYLIPRSYSEITKNSAKAFDVLYMEKLSDGAANARFNVGTTEEQQLDDATLSAWQWTPDGDASRSTELVLTDVTTRADTSIHAGNEIVAFGSSFPAGVKYLRVGETSASEIPDGETFDARVFQVCGKKIVLMKKKRVYIYNTENDTVVELPEDEIFLKKDSGGNHTRNTLRCDGNLVATLNDVSKVADKLMIKIVDITEDEPRIIRIKNAEYRDSLVDSIDISAELGIVAISSNNKKLLAYAPVSDLANQQVIDLSDYQGISNREIHIVENGVVYADRKNKIRFLLFDDNTTTAVTDQAIGRSGNGYIANHEKLVISTEQKKGDRYEMAISNAPEPPYTIDGTGDKIDGTSGQLGMAGVAAIAPDGSIFIAGTPSGGIGTGEHLQVLQAGHEAWQPVYSADSEVFGAIDVVASERLVAFKYGGRKEAKIGYVTFGESVDVGQMLEGANAAKAEAEELANKAAAEAEIEKNALAETEAKVAASKKDMVFLTSYMESERQMVESFAVAFGEEEGNKKARQLTLQVMQGNGHGHLIETYELLMQ